LKRFEHSALQAETNDKKVPELGLFEAADSA